VALLLLGVLVAALVLSNDDEKSPAQPGPRQPRSSAPTSASPSSTAPSSTAPSSTATSAPPSSSAPTTSAPPATVTIDENDYLGRDVKDVEKELKDLKLKVDTVEIDNPGTETEGAVAGVDPDGELQEGDPVTVSYYGKSPVPEVTPGTTPVPSEHGKGKGTTKGNAGGKGR
jgi:serine/threonine-protein kinase